MLIFYCFHSFLICDVLGQGFITNNERALEELFGDDENTRKGVACLTVMASRLATVFASLRVRILCFEVLIENQLKSFLKHEFFFNLSGISFCALPSCQVP